MSRTITGLVCLFLLFGLAVSAAPANAMSQNMMTAIPDGTQPPVPPKGPGITARMLDGTQPPVPPKGPGAMEWMLDGTQPPVPPKGPGAVA